MQPLALLERLVVVEDRDEAVDVGEEEQEQLRALIQQSPAWQEIQSSEHRAGRKQQITQALMNYRAQRDAWDSLC